MFVHIAAALLCLGIGAYGTLIILGLCNVSAAAGKRSMQPSNGNYGEYLSSSTCSLCERGVLPIRDYSIEVSGQNHPKTDNHQDVWVKRTGSARVRFQ